MNADELLALINEYGEATRKIGAADKSGDSMRSASSVAADLLERIRSAVRELNSSQLHSLGKRIAYADMVGKIDRIIHDPHWSTAGALREVRKHAVAGMTHDGRLPTVDAAESQPEPKSHTARTIRLVKTQARAEFAQQIISAVMPSRNTNDVVIIERIIDLCGDAIEEQRKAVLFGGAE